MHPVSCRVCGSCVLVKKNTLAHTLVQWTSDTERCAELSRHGEPGTVPTCSRLRDSIEADVRSGLVPVAEP